MTASTSTSRLRDLVKGQRSAELTHGSGIFATTVWHISRLILLIALLILIPFILPVSFGVRLYRNILVYFVKRRLGIRVTPCSGGDAVWLQDTKENPAIINAVLCLKGHADVTLWRRIILDRLVDAVDPDNPRENLFPKVTKFPAKVLHRYVWVEEDEFDIRDHVVEYPGDVPAKDSRRLEEVVSELCSKPLPLQRAAWQLTLLMPRTPECRNNEEDTYSSSSSDGAQQTYHIILRMHHSIADGISLVRLLMQRLVDDPPQSPRPPRISVRGRIMRLLRAVYEGPALLLERICYKKDCTILHGPQLSGCKLLAWSEPIPLDLIKRMKTAAGTTVNDVLMACLAAAIRTYLIQNDCAKSKEILSYVPVDIRPPGGKVVLDNQFALVFLSLPLDQSDILDTLATTKQRMDQVKASSEPLVNSLVIRYGMNRFPNWLTSAAFNWFARKCSMILSNIPGPQQELTISGETMDALVFWPPQRDNVGLGVSIFSYNGQVRLGIMVDKAVMTDPHPLMDLFVAKIKEMASALKLD